MLLLRLLPLPFVLLSHSSPANPAPRYKTPDGKPTNAFGHGEAALPRMYAEAVIRETHEQWRALKNGEVGESADGVWIG